jgi:hypothetical protein
LRKYLISPLSNLIGSDQLEIGDKVVVTHGNGILTFRRHAGQVVLPIPPLKTEKPEPIPFVPHDGRKWTPFIDPLIRPDASKQPRN